jgi:hypothetical protein
VTAVDLMQAVAQAGGRLIPEGGYLTVEAPNPLPPELVEELRAHKPEILAKLEASTRSPTDEVLSWTLADVDGQRARIKIRSQLLGCDLWLVPSGDPGPGEGLPVYTTTEVRELLKLRPEDLPDAVQRVPIAKVAMGPGAVVEAVTTR